ncbi:MAG TPA: hypothetical protein VHA10_21930 [Hypericibacter adhaerens]|jgi:hypothetical protein|uniref:hypothetical protein n=1 Tax=Hypericibacter adhaerens TaxID=2602016 RepID=UPI002C8132CB|nr:hypothetical protein [Hypericibacter adhaerens]HWA45896.1 hypothetical protein [Hypericibacter adhaerens]
MSAWSLPADRAAQLALAMGYPFPIPAHSYLFENGRALPWPDAVDYRDRLPVLAIGSNRSPEQLARKFDPARFDPGRGPQRIPVTCAWLEDHDVVFAAHVTGYGAIPANLRRVPGMRVRLAVTWLDPTQLEAMHRTETTGGNYRYVRLDGIRLALEQPGPGGIRSLDSVTAYVSPFGFMAHEGQPLGLAALEAEGRPHPAATVAEALDHVRRRARDERSLEDFICGAIGDEALRRRLTLLIRETALPFAHPGVTILQG